MDAAGAYRHCEEVVRSQARNFSYGIRLLPPPKRRALSAVYAFARRIDDIGDDIDAPPDTRLAALAAERDRLAGLDAHPDDPVMVALADAARRMPVPLEAFGELIDGCEADVRGAAYDTFDDLLWYCRCVAGSIGRLSLGVFGTGDLRVARARADALGVALQLTNILRDVREDRLGGRVYLPAKDLARFGCTLDQDASGRFTDPPEQLATLVRFQAARAGEWYGNGLRLLPMLDRRSAACTGTMAGIYRRLLRRITADPASALASRMSLPAWEKAAVAATALTGIRR
ncbi:presqualene diphosphate synthase HpnD [Actinomadura violacea]|uniref:Presqualene diphosphate synthase HpnD n=1 Tax=Actinomadura violacea TaxID=2819934 RepID=A0ABS3S929_9ACTN|nr:presqualene diphosphate synthase HpnD [Actinomadura violacea]MBO2465515.1 presqualene diphosphate synthase HpnD [Actinomadura violacea]